MTDPKITPELVQEHNLTPEEYDRITAMLGRMPTFPELGIFSALWSEHCSYKHSRPVLKTFPTTGRQVVQGPGENAGVLRLPGGWAVAFKIESHNHPSADPSPSDADVSYTDTLRTAARIVGLRFLDHVIVAGANWSSVLNR